MGDTEVKEYILLSLLSWKMYSSHIPKLLKSTFCKFYYEPYILHKFLIISIVKRR